MSMNLNARVDGVVLQLWQTPTQISYTIMGLEGLSKLNGKKAVEALKRYCLWVKYSINGSYSSVEEIKRVGNSIKEHLDYIDSHLCKKKVEVWVM